MATFCRKYSEDFWDEQISALYLSGAHADEAVPCYREQRACAEDLVFICDIHEGDIVAVYKDIHLEKYVLIIDRKVQILDADFEKPMARYLQGSLDVHGLLAEEMWRSW